LQLQSVDLGDWNYAAAAASPFTLFINS